MDSRGHPMIKAVGAVAGDAASYAVFDELFRGIFAARAWHVPEGRHTTTLDPSLATADVLACDPSPSGQYVVSARVRAARNLSSACFCPSLSHEERASVEATLTK